MTTLSTKTPADTFKSLLTINVPSSGTATGLDGTLRSIEDGAGHQSPLSLSQSQVALASMVWPGSGAVTGALLRVSSTSGFLEWHTTTSADIIAALGYTPANSTSATFNSAVKIEAATIDTQITTVTTTAVTTVYTFATTTGGTVKFLCQVKDSSTSAFHSEELLVVTDSSILDMTGFAIVTTQSPLGTFDVAMNGSNVVLTFQASAASNKTVTIVATSVIG